jgi:hypothetical protein
MSVKVIIYKGKPLKQVVLKQAVTTIGRKSSCDISIKDPAVSGNHARIVKVGKNYIIQDTNSTNGVVIGGEKIKQHILKNSDVIRLGTHHMKIFMSVKKPKPAKPDRTELPTLARDKVKGYLEVISGGKIGDTIDLEKGLTTIGEPGIQIAAVSRRPLGHFIIHVDGGKDRNKVPLVNGESIGFQSRKLVADDMIEVAGMQMKYHER